DGDRLAVPRAVAVGARGAVDGVLQHARQAVVVLGGREEDRVGGADLLLELDDLRRRVLFVVLIEERQPGDVVKLELRACGAKFARRAQRGLVVRVLAQAARDAEDRDLLCHGVLQGDEEAEREICTAACFNLTSVLLDAVMAAIEEQKRGISCAGLFCLPPRRLSAAPPTSERRKPGTSSSPCTRAAECSPRSSTRRSS